MYRFEDAFSGVEEDKKEELVAQMERAISRAKVCLSNKDFEEYRAEYVKAEGKQIALMIAFTNGFMAQDNGDMAYYGAKIARMLTRLSDLRTLLDAVESDLRKEKYVEADNA
jgi:hypothetical protein